MSGSRLVLIGRGLAALAGAALVALAFSIPVEPTLSGGYTLEGWWTAMLGVSLTTAGLTWATAWRRTGLLAALFVLSTAAQLGITYPHWAMSIRVSPDQFERPEHYLGVAVLLLEGLTVLALTARHLRTLAGFFRSVLTPIRLAALTAIFSVTAVNAAAYYPQVFEGGFATEIVGRWFLAGGIILAVNLLLLWHIAASMPSEGLSRLSSRVTGWVSVPGYEGPARPLDAKLPWYLAGFVLVITVFFARVILRGTAQFGDEVVYQFMADVFARGALGVPAPPVPDAFEMYLVEVRDGMRYGVIIPGFPLVLAIGSFFGVPWLVSPLLGALSIPVAHALVTRLVDRGTANVVVVLIATSPWFLILSSVYQPHALTLLSALVSWLAVHRATTEHSPTWGLVGGLAAGVAFSVRPLDGIVIGGAGALFALSTLGRTRASFGILAAFVMGCIGTGAISLAINYAMTGDPLKYAMNQYFDREWGPGANRLGFGPDVGQVWGVLDPIPGHGWRDVLFNLNLNFFTLNYELMGWGIGSLFLLSVHLVWGRRSPMDRAWVAFMAAAIALYSLYWFSGGPDYGPRYWYSLLPPLMLLSARGLVTLVSVLRERTQVSALGTRIGLVCLLLCVVSLAAYDPWRVVAKYVDYRSKTPLFHELLESGAFGSDGLVIVDADGEGEYAALELNDLVPGENGPVFARDLGPESNTALVAAFPGRPVYRATLRITPQGKVVTVTPVTSGTGSGD